jgi:hypothetical protein
MVPEASARDFSNSLGMTKKKKRTLAWELMAILATG